MRVKRYRAEAVLGLLQVLCQRCNGLKGATMEQRGIHELPALPLSDALPAWVTEDLV